MARAPHGGSRDGGGVTPSGAARRAAAHRLVGLGNLGGCALDSVAFW